MSMQHDDRDRTIAIAGIFQAAYLVFELAKHGQCDSAAAKHSIDSLFEFDPSTVDAVYSGLKGVQAGLRVLIAQLEQPAQRNLQITRYVIAMIQHADKLLKDPQRFAELGHDLERLAEKSKAFALTEFSRNAQLARLYQHYISPLDPKIMVRGEPLYLQNPQITEQIRALLLAGIRAAVLWRQCQGRRWHLLVKRRRTAEITQQLLNTVNSD